LLYPTCVFAASTKLYSKVLLPWTIAIYIVIIYTHNTSNFIPHANILDQRSACLPKQDKADAEDESIK